MNQKRSKEITERSNELFIEWLKSLLNETEAAKITMDNYRNYLPKQTHLYANKQLWLTAYTPRWIKNKLKSDLKKVNDQIKRIESQIKNIDDIDLHIQNFTSICKKSFVYGPSKSTFSTA